MIYNVTVCKINVLASNFGIYLEDKFLELKSDSVTDT